MNTLKDYLKTLDAGAILDIACGGGNFTTRLIEDLKSHTSVTGLDIRAELEESFLENVKGKNVTFVTSTIADYLQRENTFDTISISNALHHLEGIEDMLADLKKILNANGTVIINEMYCEDLTPAQETQRDLHHFMAALQRAQGEYHRETYARQEIKDMIAQAGLTILHTYDHRNHDAPVEKQTDESERFTGRIQGAVDKAYPDGLPSELASEYERLKKRAAEIGIAPPTQLTLVCTFK